MSQRAAARRSATVLAGLAGVASLAAREGTGTVTTALQEVQPSAPAETGLTALLVLAGALVALLAWCWLTLCVTVALHDALVARRGTAPARAGGVLRPALLRGALGLACLGAGSLAVPAHAVEPAAPFGVLDGLLLPARVADDGPDPHPPHTWREPDRVPATGAVCRVRPGDTLWALTERLLAHRGVPVTPDRVAEGWRQLHGANRATLGDDPDLILPGTLLRVPTGLRGANR